MSDNAFQATGQCYPIAASGNAGGVVTMITAATTVNTFWVANPSNASVLVNIVQPGGNTSLTFPTGGVPQGGVMFPPNFANSIGGPAGGPLTANCAIVCVSSGGTNTSATIYITPGEGL